VKFGNDQIFDMENFDEVSRRIEWSKNEFSHSLSAAANGGGPSRVPSGPACRQAGQFHIFTRQDHRGAGHSLLAELQEIHQRPAITLS
jgi:hypothetical protein